jgi:glycosyltransferase involved in cell wall biosynthesis
LNIQSSGSRKAEGVSSDKILSDALALIFRRSMLWTPERQAPSDWIQHVPFAFWLVDVLRPRRIVDLGTHNGVSYSAMCQAVKTLGLVTSCFAIDSWKGDEYGGSYGEHVYPDFANFHDRRYSVFSRLVRSTFDEAWRDFEDGSIDLLHVDGLHTYEVVRYEYQSWLPKLSPNAVVLFHDTNILERGFGVFRLWNEITAGKPRFSFLHGHGLGALGLGQDYPDALDVLFGGDEDSRLVSSIRETFEALGRSVEALSQRSSVNQIPLERTSEISELRQALLEPNSTISVLDRALAPGEGKVKEHIDRDALINRLLETRSWLVTKALRFAGRVMRPEWALPLSGLRPVLLGVRSLHQQFRAAYILLHLARRAIAYYGSSTKAFAGAIRILLRDGPAGVKHRADMLVEGGISHLGSTATGDRNQFDYKHTIDVGFSPKVSIIVPNFNHEEFLRTRLESIYNQTYKNFEVILLDDCSTDQSVKLLQEYASRYSKITRYCFNRINSGQVFQQWKRGLELATGDLVWIAESDDYCSNNLLDELVKFFTNQAVMLAFCRSEFVRGNPAARWWTMEDYLGDLNLDCWSRPFIKSAHWLVNNAWGIKNIIPNVSSAVFRNPGYLDLFDDREWTVLKLCGDWIFYLTIVRGGLIAYSPKATNFYRQHLDNISVKAQREDVYYREHEIVGKYLVSLYLLNPVVMERQRKQLYQHWTIMRGDSSKDRFVSLYDFDRIQTSANERMPNVIVAAYGVIDGGGGIFQITLANILKARGDAVTFFNCSSQTTVWEVVTKLRKDIPILQLDGSSNIASVFHDLGIEIVHSRHAWVNVLLSAHKQS